MTRLRLIRVALPVPLRRTFDYLAPPACADQALQPGCRVRVPFGRKRTLAGLILSRPGSTDVSPGKLKSALAAVDPQPLLSGPHLGFLLQAAAYYQHPVGDALLRTLPGKLRRAETTVAAPDRRFTLLPDAADAISRLQNAPRQRDAVRLLAAAGEGLTLAALAERGITRTTVRALEKKGLVHCVPPSPGHTQSDTAREEILLGGEQAGAAAGIARTLGKFSVHVLNGVTGSGKTEVYLAVVAEALRRGEQALVLVPEIGLTPQFVDRVRRRIGMEVAVLHSGLSDGDRARDWMAAREGRARVVLGTRSAIWTPLMRPGVIVVDEEHDLSYKQQDGFRYSARDMAVARGKAEGIPVILGSATPSLETLRNVMDGRYVEHRLTQRAAGAPAPAVRFINLRGARRVGALSTPMIDAVRAEVRNGNQVLLFLNRRGYSPTLQCHTCGTVLECPRCDVSYTWHKQRNRLRCHHCGADRPASLRCPRCPDSELEQIGHGTERVEETLAQQMPEARILRIDRDSTRARGAMGRLVAMVHAKQADILIGTQMLAKGHHFPGLTLAGVIDADRGLFSSDFRAAERMAQLIVQVCGRAGRGEQPGQVLIQTHHPDHPLLRSLVEHGYGQFARLALAERAAAQLPPFSYLAMLRAEHHQAAPALRFLDQARTRLAALHPRLQLFGPLPSALERRAGRFRFQLLIQANRRAQLARALPPWLRELETQPLAGKVRWSLDVDPQEMI
ncbi:MAG: primosomal protein N' [Gammaproteobacteria bacterium]|nr:primosomal protein N' [Gammaproteobacteria bacterium]